jgi:hypothetical protein
MKTSMKNKALLLALALLAALLALSSCRDTSLDPVFYALATEQPLADDRGFPDEVTVERILKVPDIGGGRYFAAAGRLYTRGDGATDKWSVIDFPASLTNVLCNTLEVFNGGSGDYLYVGFFDTSGVGRGLWRADPATFDPATSSITWEQLMDSNVFDGKQIIMIRAVGTRLFVSTRSGNANALCSGTDGTTFAAASLTPAPPTDIPITDAAQDSYASNYWLIVGSLLYKDTAGNLSFDHFAGKFPPNPDPPAGRPDAGDTTFGGLFDNGTTFYISAGNGRLFSTADGGGTWTTVPKRIDDSSGDPIPFTVFVQPAVDATGAAYVATKGYGYYRFPGGDITATPVRSPDYSISQLYSGAINDFLYDGSTSPERLFLATARSGLWRGEFAGGSSWTWKQE